MAVIKIYADFNERTEHGLYYVLRYGDASLEEKIADLNLNVGDQVILFQDEDDFEVTAVLDYRYSEFLGRKAWVATPDWSTLVRK
jgi:hypothetical protein